jgi:uncharacterized protein DUF3800
MSESHVINSCLDESFDPKDKGVFVVGGLLGRGMAIYELERRWERVRTRSDINIKYFKASECERGSGEFAKFVNDPAKITPDEKAKLTSISHDFLDAIAHGVYEPSYLIVAGIGIVNKDFYEVIQDDYARSVLGETPYRLAYDLTMIQSAWAVKEVGRGDCACFFCDESEEHSNDAPIAYVNLKETNPRAAEYMGAFGMGDDKLYPVLQAADAVVYEVRRALNLALGQWQGTLRKQFRVLDDAKMISLIQHTTKDQLLRIVELHKPGEPFKLDEIMDMVFHEDVKITI